MAAGQRLTTLRRFAWGVVTGALFLTGTPIAATTASAAQPSHAAASTASIASAGQVWGWPVLRQGPNSMWPQSTVRSLQYLLRAHGAWIAVDGVFGPGTKAAVVAFQRTHRLVVDGVAGNQTWGSLIITVQQGSRGEAVRAVQQQINARNMKNGHTLDVDGIFGPKTRSAVIGFQQTLASSNKSFPVDGIVGPLTWPPLVDGAYSG
jgi:peptidoglycan hydrolase-like protein with peptidoglycan-binding domain